MEIILAKWVAAQFYASIAYILTPTSFICPPKHEYAILEHGFIFNDASTLKAFSILTQKATPSFSITTSWVRYNAQKDVGIHTRKTFGSLLFVFVFMPHLKPLLHRRNCTCLTHILQLLYWESERLKTLTSPTDIQKKTPNTEVIKLKKAYTEILKMLFLSATLLTYLTDTCRWTVSMLQDRKLWVNTKAVMMPLEQLQHTITEL